MYLWWSMSKRFDIGAKLTELLEKVHAWRDLFSYFLGNMYFFQKLKKVLSDNVFMMVQLSFLFLHIVLFVYFYDEL